MREVLKIFYNSRMSVGATPTIRSIATLIGDTPPHSMSELYSIGFSNGNSPVSGLISLSSFRNQLIGLKYGTRKIQALDIEAGDLFGWHVAISGDGNTVIVGAPGKVHDEWVPKGAVYIFRRTPRPMTGAIWIQQQTIRTNNVYDTVFGLSVAISNDGNTFIVGGSTSEGGLRGVAAYVFTRFGSEWIEQQRLQGEFDSVRVKSSIVAISSDGNTAIVGFPDLSVAYIFTRSAQTLTWTEQQKFEGALFFGCAAAFSDDGNTVIVGASGDHTGGFVAGSAYIFTRSGSVWTEQQKIQASDIKEYDRFGASVTISGDGNTAIVGGVNATGVYTFIRSGTTWTQQRKIQPSVYDFEKLWPVAISGDGNTAIFGVPNVNTAYVFTRFGSEWIEQPKIQGVGLFGYSVAISRDGRSSIVGAVSDDTGGVDAGAASTSVASFFIPVYLAHEGGTVTTVGDYKIHTFTESGTFTVVPEGATTMEYLIVAGGGAGGGNHGGGGGAGGLLTGTIENVTPGSYTITVGAGGAAVYNGTGLNGTNSTALGITAIGGGGGGRGYSSTDSTPGNKGGSGGGGGAYGYGQQGINGQGFEGGRGIFDDRFRGHGAGGGGAGGPGGDTRISAEFNRGISGRGGLHKSSSISGTSVDYAGGGSGGRWGGTRVIDVDSGIGGTSGGGGLGGNRVNGIDYPGGPGIDGTGGGGGGGGDYIGQGGKGGDGIVIIRYIPVS